MKIDKEKIILFTLISVFVIGIGFFVYSLSKDLKMATEFNGDSVVDKYILDDFSKQTIMPIAKAESGYQIADSFDNDLTIEYSDPAQNSKEEVQKNKNEFKIEFPSDYKEPINIKLDEQRIIQVTNRNGNNYVSKLITQDIPLVVESQESKDIENETQITKQIESKQNISYLKYQDKNKRVSAYYAYQKESQEKKLKHWNVYERQDENNKEEEESYQISNAKIKLSEKGEVEVFYFGQSDIQNEQVMAQADHSLMERAQRVLQKEAGEDILNSKSSTPDLIIPKPFYINKNGDKIDLQWDVDSKENLISLKFTPAKDEYPIALDPTYQFIAPNGGGTISVDFAGSGTIFTMASGDFNYDSKIDLVVGASNYSTNTGRVYIFYNDGAIPTLASGADVIIIGEATENYFGAYLTSGDFNHDGRTDLVVGAPSYSTNLGRIYLFYNDGTISTTAATADVLITGEAASKFGSAMTSGDFNNDGKTDLAVGGYIYSAFAGRTYIFYADETNNFGTATCSGTPALCSAANGDVIITGDANTYFGNAITAGDFNYDGTTDLAVGANNYSTSTGKAYIFYCDGTIPTTAATADVTITGEATNSIFGYTLASGDFNYDGRVDLAVGAYGYTTSTGRVYIFYNDGTIPTLASSADKIITGEATSNAFGLKFASGDFNADGKTDLAVGAYGYTTNTGRAYIFYNDGSMPTTSATADVIITGEATNYYFGTLIISGDFDADGKSDLVVGGKDAGGLGRIYLLYSNVATLGVTIVNKFGYSLAAGDFNNDGKVDLAVGAPAYLTNNGRVYIFYNDPMIPTSAATADVEITGENNGFFFGLCIISGDFNYDNKTDLAVGSPSHSTNTGRVYLFYNDGIYPTLASAADVAIDGETTDNYFGAAMANGDFNYDGKIDLAVGAYRHTNYTGKAYVFYADGTNNFGTAACTGSSPTVCLASNGDVKITGTTANDYFAYSLVGADLNANSRTDLIIGAIFYSSGAGRAYVFYNDGTIPTTAATADVIITGEASSYFSYAMTSGDFDYDGDVDLAIGGYVFTTNDGKAYIFYADGTNNFGTAACSGTPALCSAVNGDVKITGEADSYFGLSLASGDFNNDSRIDLAIGAPAYTTNTGRVYIFNNDGSIPTTAATADVKISGETTSNYFGCAVVGGDFNYDNKTDLIVGAYTYSSNLGRTYIFYNDGSYPSLAADSEFKLFGNDDETVKVDDVKIRGTGGVLRGGAVKMR